MYLVFQNDEESPKVPAVEFEKEWKEFIFGLKQEMKIIEFMPVRGGKTTKQKIRSERRSSGMSTVPALKPVELAKPTQLIKTKVIEHMEPLDRQPLVLPQINMKKPKVHIVHEHAHTLDPDLLLIQQDLNYAKRVMAN